MTDSFALYLGVFLVGLVIGSFLNVCIVRLPAGQSVITPRSRCPSCLTPVSWVDNIPVISYIWLGGRCRTCQGHISIRYPLVELMNGIGYMAIVAMFGFTPEAGVYAVFFSALLVVGWIDLDHFIIPDLISVPGIVLGLLASSTVLPTGFLNSVIGIVVGGGLLWVLAILSPYLFGKEGLGGGDIKLLAMIGAFLGWQQALLTLMLASLLGALIGIGLLAFKIMERGHYIPFGPFLVFGALVALFFHGDVVHWYIRMMW